MNRFYSPVTPGRRFMVSRFFSNLTRKKPEKKLLCVLRSKSGRNGFGHITVRHRGGGSKRRYRVIDFRRDKEGVIGFVTAIEYDPCRSARLALVSYSDGDKRYILANHNMVLGSPVLSGESGAVAVGTSLKLQNVPVGSVISCIELRPGKGAVCVRAAGAFAQLMAKEQGYALIRLPSGELKRVLLECSAVLGQIGNLEHSVAVKGKAGVSRKLGIRPTVRGVAMNPVDHPHGGGEGKSKGGNHPQSPWGQSAKGFKTRNNKRTDFTIVKNK